MSRVPARPAPADAAHSLPKTLDDDRRADDGWLFRQELVDCGKGASGRCLKCANGPSHGPDWYRYRWYDGKMHKRYVGKIMPQKAGDWSPVPRDASPEQSRSTSSTWA